MRRALLTPYAPSYDNELMKRKINTYAALLCVTLIGSAATLTIVRFANATEYPPGFDYSSVIPTSLLNK